MKNRFKLCFVMASLLLLVGCSKPEKEIAKANLGDIKATSSKETTTKRTTHSTTSSSSTTKVETTDLLENDHPQKFIDAYHEFSMKGNPMPPEQRGDSPRPDGFFEKIGLTVEEYYPIFWGIKDYYGNAAKKGWLTEEENQLAQQSANEKLENGDYALHPKTAKQEVTDDNVLDYAEQFVQETTQWHLNYMETSKDSEGNFTVHFMSKNPEDKNINGYFKITPTGMVSRYSNLGSLLGEEKQIILP